MLVLTHIRDNFAAAFLPRIGEWACAAMILAIGVDLSVNVTLMADARSPAYAALLDWAPQHSWASLMIGLGMLRLMILLVNGAWRRSPHYRAAIAFLCCFFWWQITKSLLSVYGIPWILGAGVLGMDFMNMVRAAGDARIVDHAFEKGRQEGGRN